MLIRDQASHRAALPIEKIPPCLVCGKYSERPFIHFLAQHSGGDVMLHPDCAAVLQLKLARDLWEYQAEYQKKLSFKPKE